MNHLNITERHNKTVTILDLAGNIRIGDDPIKLRTALRVLVEEGKKNILVNMADISHIDSSGLGELVAGFVAVRKSGGELKLFNLTKRVNELMMITKLLTVFEVFESEAEAVESFQDASEDSETEQNRYVTGELDQALVNF